MPSSFPREVRDDTLRSVLESIPQQIFVLRPDFTMEFANRAILEYHGEALAAILFTSNVFERDRALHHPDDLPRVQEEGSYRLPRGLPVELEARLLAGDGTYRWFRMHINPVTDAHGKVVCWYGTRSDIDALKRGEARMREHARETRMLADFVSQQLFTLDTSGRILDANHAALEYTGLLQNVIERAVIATKDATLVLGSRADERPPDTVAPHRTLAEVEREHIVQTLRTTSWVIGGWNGAAARLGLSRTTLIATMQRLGVTTDAKPRRRAVARHHHDAPDGRRAAHAFLTRVAFNDG
jgi:PAS domain S-box-containing protein